MSERQLLIDYQQFDVNPAIIAESIKLGGPLIVSGILQRANIKNANQRIYPKNILMREAKKYSDVQIKERRALGELDHPQDEIVNLSNVSHNIREIHWSGNDLIGTIEVLSTPAGNILKELFKSGIKLGISSRGLGSLEETDEGNLVQDDYSLVSFDFVSQPSTQGAYMRPINEGVDKSLLKPNKYAKVSNIITNILSGM